jgi:hypothetical protein
MISTDAVLTLITQQGPCVPADLTSATQTDSIILGAIFSSLVEQKKIKITQLKWGGSPLYYAPGQEDLIQKLYTKLNEKDKRAYDLLKEEGILRDDELTPLQRTCLRNLPDFAIQLKVTKQQNPLIFWRWYLYPHDVAISRIHQLLQPAEQPVEQSIPIVAEKLPEKTDQQQLPIQPPIPHKDRVVLASQTIQLADDDLTQPDVDLSPKQPFSQKQSVVASVAQPFNRASTQSSSLATSELQSSAQVETARVKTTLQKQNTSTVSPASPLVAHKNPVVQSNQLNQSNQSTQVVSDSFVLLVQNALLPSTIRQVVIHKKQAEFDALLDLQTQFGVVICSLKAKQKKKHSDADLASALNTALLSHSYCAYVYTGELTKKAVAFSQQHPVLLIQLK